jgi:hypothetical protein
MVTDFAVFSSVAGFYGFQIVAQFVIVCEVGLTIVKNPVIQLR